MKLFWQTPDGRAKLYHGDSRWMPEIETESIDMIATSPPYWGKRDYGEDVVAVWGGEDGCEHEWDIEEHRDKRGIEGSTLVGSFQAEALRLNFEAGYCSLCGAWRGQLGLEPTWQEYIAHLCECAEEWWRVLKPTGNLFVNIGDTFFGGKGQSGQGSPEYQAARKDISINKPQDHIAGPGLVRPQDQGPGIPKNKLGIPYRLRFALNDMGWVSRDDIPWVKGKLYPDGVYSKTAMPESVKRRFACSYEMVMRFVKTPKMNYYVNEKTLESRDKPPKERIEGRDFEWREHARCEGKGCDSPRCHDGLIKYSFWHGVDQWFDLDAVRRPHLHSSLMRDKYAYNTAMGARDKFPGETREGRGYVRAKTADESSFKPPGTLRQAPEPGEPHALHPAGANPGDVWIIQPEPFKEAHYAVWPSKLCERMIKVGCPKEVCPKCGKPRERITKPGKRIETGGSRKKATPGIGDITTRTGYHPSITIGWSGCGCGVGFVPGVVLDPFFGGSGRIARVALYLGRNVTGVDLKEEYLEMAKKRLLQGVLL